MATHRKYSTISSKGSMQKKAPDEVDDDRKRPYDAMYKVSLLDRVRNVFSESYRFSVSMRLINMFVKIVSVVLYIIQMEMDCKWEAEDDLSQHCKNAKIWDEEAAQADDDGEWTINYRKILRVDRPDLLWVLQTVVAALSIFLTFLIMSVGRRLSILQWIFSPNLILELLSHVPFIVTIGLVNYKKIYQNIYIPSFLSCWLARRAAQNAVADMNRSRDSGNGFTEQLVTVISFILCIVLTITCGMQWLQLAGQNRVNMLNSFYFALVTASTVGYGDISPDWWLSRIFVAIMIIIMLIILVPLLDELGTALNEKKATGGSYSATRAKRETHIVLSITKLRADAVCDFLTEFYAQKRLRNYYVVLLTPSTMDAETSRVLQMTRWRGQVMYLNGTVFRGEDLERAKIIHAEACFILGTRGSDRIAMDRLTILRSWAVKDFAPQITQYVLTFRPEAKMHTKHVEYTVCMEEIKYAMLANTCICPGLTTFLTLMLHTSDGKEGSTSKDEWTSFGVSLIGIRSAEPGAPIRLNPGPAYHLKDSDICYYWSICREEHFEFTNDHPKESEAGGPPLSGGSNSNPWRQPNIPQDSPDTNTSKYIIGFPSVTPYVGTSRVQCHLLKKARDSCCLWLSEPCDHVNAVTASDYKWRNRSIILSSQIAMNGLWNFIVPLRAHYRKASELRPIVLMVEEDPDQAFMDGVVAFPMVYLMKGTFTSVDDVLSAGVNLADFFIVMNRDTGGTDDGEEYAADSDTIVAVQTITRLFPRLYVITELAYANNMRFVQFDPADAYALMMSRIEKAERELGSNIPFLFRLPFAAGQVFSGDMLDTLLYQTFAKSYMIQFVRLLLGMDQVSGCGYLDGIRLAKEPTRAKTYGELYEQVCSSNGDIPIGLYRTINMSQTEDRQIGQMDQLVLTMQANKKAKEQNLSTDDAANEKDDIGNLVNSRMRALGLPLSEYSQTAGNTRGKVSFVIVNPDRSLQLQPDDILFLMRSPKSAVSERERSDQRSNYGAEPPLRERRERHRSQSAGHKPRVGNRRHSSKVADSTSSLPKNNGSNAPRANMRLVDV